MCLYDRPAGLFPPSGAAHYLREQREGPLVAAEVVAVKRLIGHEHAHQRDPLEVQPLGDHLRADHHIVQPGGKVAELLVIRRTPRHGVGVHAKNTRCGKELCQLFLGLLRTVSGKPQIRLAAGRTGPRHGGQPPDQALV